MTEPIRPLLTVTGADDAEMCGPDGCMIPASHPAHTPHPIERESEIMTTPITALDQFHLAFADRFNAGDVDGLAALTTPEAIFVPAPGTPVQGAEAVKGAMEQFMAIGLPISMSVRHAFEAKGIGLVIADWKIEGTAADGNDVSIAGSTSDVVVYDEEAGWRIVIDNPFGTA